MGEPKLKPIGSIDTGAATPKAKKKLPVSNGEKGEKETSPIATAETTIYTRKEKKETGPIATAETTIYTGEIDDIELEKLTQEMQDVQFLETLAARLKLITDKTLSEEESEKETDSINNNSSFTYKIKKLLELYKARDMKDIHDREAIYNIIYNAMKKMASKEELKAFAERTEKLKQAKSEEEWNILDRETKKELMQKLEKIKKDYNYEEIYKIMKLGLQKGTYNLN